MIVADRKKFDLAAIRRQQGIKCPDCHCRLLWKVYDTTPKGGVIKRIRKCANCGREIRTTERMDE